MADTSDGAEGRRPPTRAVGRAVLIAVVIGAVTVVGVQRNRQLELERRDEADEAVAATVVGEVGVDLERGLRGLAAVARAVPTAGLGALSGPAATSAVPGATSVGLVPADGSAPASGPSPLSEDDRSLPEVAAALDRARDTGDPQVAGTIHQAGGPRTPLVAPVYGPGAQPGDPLTSVDRRARLTGWVVAPVDTAALAASHTPDGAVARIAVDAVPGGPGDGLAERVLTIDGRALHVLAGRPGSVGWSGWSVALAVGGAVASLIAGVGVLAVGRRLRLQAAEARRRGAQVRLIGDVAPLVQQSLELAEVLPAVAVQLSDHFGLAGVALSTGSSRAGQTELFSIGDAPAPGAKPVLQPPAELASGQTLALALQRGGRSVALLQIVAGRSLDASELESLRALSELVTAAMVNASLYASQQEALQGLRELDGLKTVFLGTASHELRTPATAIAGFASLLTASWDRFSDEQRRDFANRIAANARSLSAVVQDLLDFSLLDHGSLVVGVEPIDLGPFAEAVVDRLAPVFTNHAISCTTAPTPLVAGDPNGLERVITNLLTNAVKFSPTGSNIAVAVAASGDGAELVVSDEGPGVPVDERERVFTRFYRGSGEAVVQTRGVGIGLSVVAELVERMHGEITVDDAPGGGARFTLRLPPAVQAVAEPEERDASPA